jgi:hypothetical protein
MRRTCWRWLLGATAPTVLLLGLTSCGANGPTLSTGGLDGASIPTHPGHLAGYSTPVENLSGSPVTLERVALLAIPGHRTPRLVHAAVLIGHREQITAARGWPIAPSRPLPGYLLQPWAWRQAHHLGPMPDLIAYAVVANRPGIYDAAGLIITYRAGGTQYQQKVYYGATDCVTTRPLSKLGSWCGNAGNATMDAMTRLAGNG